MAISFVNAGGSNSTLASPTATTLTVPTGVVDGDVMVAVFACQSSNASAPTISTPPSGWTQIGTTQTFGAASTLAAAAAYLRIASGETAGTTTYTLTWSGGRLAGSIAAFRGAVNTSVAAAQDVTATVTNSGTTAATTASYPAITTVSAGAWWVGLGALGANSTSTTAQSWTPPASWSEDDDHGSTSPTSVKNAAATIAHIGPVAVGAQSPASTTMSVSSMSVLWSVALAPQFSFRPATTLQAVNRAASF